MDINEEEVDEGLASITASRLGDLARGFILKARPILIFHHIGTDRTATIKLKRGLLKHTLSLSEDNKSDRVLLKSVSAILLLTTALNQARKLIQQGYIEI